MGELRSRRPPPAAQPQALGRPGMVVGGHGSLAERPRNGDEESMREEMGRLQRTYFEKRRERDEVVSNLRMAEKESLRKDKVLQELLATAKTGSGVPGEALDQLREDLQALLQFKRRSHELRLRLEEKEQQRTEIQHEMRVTNVAEFEEDVSSAKMEAKAKVSEWEKANTGKETSCYAKSTQFQKAAQEHLDEICTAEGGIARTQRKIVELNDERNRLEKAVNDNAEQIQRLQGKSEEIEQQQEQCQMRVDAATELAERHKRLKREREERLEELAKARQEGMASQLRSSLALSFSANSPGGGPAWEVCEELLQTAFVPIPGAAQWEAQALLCRCRRVLQASGHSGLDALAAEDMDGDGRLSTGELAAALHSLHVPGSDFPDVQRLVSALHPALLSGDLVSIVDFVLALPLQPTPPAPEDLPRALEALKWSCRRRGIAEVDVRSSFTVWASSPTADVEALASDFCLEQLHLDRTSARAIARGLDVLREDIGSLLPSWRRYSARGRAAMLLRFVRDAARRRDSVLPMLKVEHMDLEAFLQVKHHLGPAWSCEDLEEVALLSELEPATDGASPIVAAQRLARAASTSSGLATEYPEVKELCFEDAWNATERAASGLPPRRMAPSVPAHVPAPPVPPGPAPPSGGVDLDQRHQQPQELHEFQAPVGPEPPPSFDPPGPQAPQPPQQPPPLGPEPPVVVEQPTAVAEDPSPSAVTVPQPPAPDPSSEEPAAGTTAATEADQGEDEQYSDDEEFADEFEEESVDDEDDSP